MENSNVVITDVNMKFSSMVHLLVMLAIASIPAAILVSVVLFGIGLAVTFLFGGVLAVVGAGL